MSRCWSAVVINMVSVIVFSFLGVLSAFSGPVALVNAVVSESVSLRSDNHDAADVLGIVERGVRVAVFPEMSSDEYLFVTPEEGSNAGRYGWVDSKRVLISDDRFGDVPRDHWARKSVRRIADEGLFVGDQRGFRGNEAVTRYELAQVLDRQLDRIDAQKDAILMALESIPLDTPLEPGTAGRLDGLVRHLEGLEDTKRILRQEVSGLRSSIERQGRRLDVVEEAWSVNESAISDLRGRIADVDGLRGQVDSLERRFSSTSLRQADDSRIRELEAEVGALRERLENMDMQRRIASTEVLVTPGPNPTREEFDEYDVFTEEDFLVDDSLDESGEVVECAEATPAVDSMRRQVEKKHDALRATLRRGLIVRRGTKGDDAVGVVSDSPTMDAVESGPDPGLVRALTRQIAHIGSSLRGLDRRMDDIEHGVLD